MCALDGLSVRKKTAPIYVVTAHYADGSGFKVLRVFSKENVAEDFAGFIRELQPAMSQITIHDTLLELEPA